jgi:drug/metabolite transporter (DMT)-like permease
VPLAVGFALLAAVLFAGSASLQQHAAQQTVSGQPRRPQAQPLHASAIIVGLWRLLGLLVHRRLWLVGWCTNLVAFGVQALALYFGSVALVQPVLVTQLLFAVPMAAAWQRRRPHRRDWASAVLICGGLVVFLSVRGVAPTDGDADRARLTLACLIAAGGVAAILLACVRVSRLVRATLLAVAAGLCFAVSAVMIKLTTDDLLYAGVAATARDWPGYTLALATLAGLLLEQGAFAGEALPPAVAAMSITNPMASYAIGVFAFGVVLPYDAPELAALAGAAALISIGAVGLAHSPLVVSDTKRRLSDAERRS